MKLQGCNMDAAHEVRTFPNGRVELAKFEGHTIGRFRLEPGWRWSESVKPIVETEWCEVHHIGYCLTGRLHVRMSDGTEAEVGAGEAYEVPPGHDAWVVGDEPYTGVDFDEEEYAVKK